MGLTESRSNLNCRDGKIRRWTLDKLDKVAEILSVNPHILCEK